MLVSEFVPATTSSPTARPTTTINAAIEKDLFSSRPTRAPGSPMLDRDFSAMQAQIESTVLRRSATFDDMDEKAKRARM